MGSPFLITTATDVSVAEAILDPKIANALQDELQLPDRDGWLSELMSEPKSKNKRRPGKLFRPGVRANSAGVMVNVGDARHGLHYLLTAAKKNWPANFLMAGGTSLSQSDQQHQIRAFRSTEVFEVCDQLVKFTKAKLDQHFDPERMTQLAIPPVEIWLRDATESRQYMLDHLGILRQFFAEASNAQLGCYLVELQ